MPVGEVPKVAVDVKEIVPVPLGVKEGVGEGVKELLGVKEGVPLLLGVTDGVVEGVGVGGTQSIIVAYPAAPAAVRRASEYV